MVTLAETALNRKSGGFTSRRRFHDLCSLAFPNSVSEKSTQYVDHCNGRRTSITYQKKRTPNNLLIDLCSLAIERSADGSAFQNYSNSQLLTSNSSSSLIAPWLNLGSGTTSTGSSPVSRTNPTSAFGGQGPITAPTSVGTSSGFGGAGSYSSGSNSIAFNLGNGPSNQALSALAPSVYDSMGGGGGVSFASNIPSAASSAAYMQNLSASYPSVINNAVNQDMGGIIQATQQWNPLSSAMASLGGALSSWGQAQASAGNASWGATGMSLGGVANTAAGLGNPVSSLLSLGQASYNVAYRDGALAGVGYGLGSLVGATQAAQTYYATNFATGQGLYGLNRIGMGFSALSVASGAAAGFQTAFVTPDALAASAPRTVSLNVLNSEFTPNGAGSAIPELPVFNGEKTQGVLVTNEGEVIPLESGNTNPAYGNYAAAGHVGRKAAIWIRENGSTGGVIYHNNPGGTCGFCNAHIPTLLPEGATLQVVGPEGTVHLPGWYNRALPYIGNSAVPKPNPFLGRN